MVCLKKISIQNYRSVKEKIQVDFPPDVPLVLIGDNNVGKSNILRAMNLLLGEFWPGNYQPEDHEFWNRNKSNAPIEISAEFKPFDDGKGNIIHQIVWRYSPNNHNQESLYYRAIDQRGNEKYVSNDLRDKCISITVSADRRLSYQLSYTSKYTLLSKLMRKFHDALTVDQNRVNRLKNEFDEITKIFHEVIEFSKFESELKKQFDKMISSMTYGLKIDFSAYDPSNYYHSLKVMPSERNNIRTFEELGTGQEQILALAFAYAYAKAFHEGIILIIEEPEVHLHPLAQHWLAREIHKMAKDELQIALATHSPAFINMLDLEGLVLVRKRSDGSTIVKQLNREELVNFCVANGARKSTTTPQTILPFYASSSTEEILAGFFAKKLVLVEGQTEALALPVYLMKVGMDVKKEDIAIVPVYGKGNLTKWWRLFIPYGIPVYIIFDNDDEHDKNRKKRHGILTTLGVSKEKLDSFCETDDWLISDRFSIFGKDFEETLRSRKRFNKYSNLEQEAIEDLGSQAKPLVARYIAERINFDRDQSGWHKFEELRDKLKVIRKPAAQEA
jgi:putative ATP-dependent endonuclease of OLD family